MSNILQRFRKTRLAPTNKVMPAPEQKADPVTPIPETIIQLEIVCVCCGQSGATHQYTNGDLYLKRLPYSYLCNDCWQERESKRNRHNIANHNTVQAKAVKADTTQLA